jgi:S-adenosylmethionine synthetase
MLHYGAAAAGCKWRLRPDAKSQVSIEYVDGTPTRITSVVISTPHADGTPHPEIEKFCTGAVADGEILKADAAGGVGGGS